MKTKILTTFILVYAVAFSLSGQMGQVLTNLTLESKILGKEMKYGVFLPDGYNESNRSYPVLYLLHGMWGNQTDWTVKGEVNRIASDLIASGKAPEMIIIMPDGLIDAFYINNYDGSVKWEDFFYDEFIPHVENEFRIINNRNNRAIAGLSMGGYGSLYHAFIHKEMFAACYAMSAAVLEREPVKPGQEISEFEKNFNLKTWGPMNDEGLPENYKQHSVQEIVKGMEKYTPPAPFGPFAGQAPLPKFFIDCGDDDFLIEANMHLVELMKEKEIPFEFRVRDGGHTWEYWRTALDIALPFVGNVFRM